ncbi:MAG: M23 family metallopeptidase [Planctomycetota bacterium]|nr:MAG: M23 family metallopeptidase [Planctomycetota bacterium]
MPRSLPCLLSLLALTAPAALAAPRKKGSKTLRWPVPNPAFDRPDFVPSSDRRQISGIFGPRLKWGSARYDHHEGFDFYAYFDPAHPRGDHDVFAVLPGVVSEVIAPSNPERTETGNKVVIAHEVPWSAFGAPAEWGKVITGYLHLSRIAVRKGQTVRAGEVVGTAGATGYTSTVHLHFNAYRASGRLVNVNPARLFSPKRFPRAVARLDKRSLDVDWIERDRASGTALIRVLLPYNAYTLDGFAVVVGKDASRAVSFEYVSANLRDRRDTGDRGLFPGLRLFPLRYNGGGAIDRVNARNQPAGWPAARYPVPMGKGVRLGFDILATDLPPDAKRIKLVVFGVLGEKITLKAPGWRHLRGA